MGTLSQFAGKGLDVTTGEYDAHEIARRCATPVEQAKKKPRARSANQRAAIHREQ